MSGQHRSEGVARYVLAPGDQLRQWWDQQSRPAKWIFGILLTIAAVAPGAFLLRSRPTGQHAPGPKPGTS